MSGIVFFDLETDPSGKTLQCIHGLREDGAVFASDSLKEWLRFAQGASFWCGFDIREKVSLLSECPDFLNDPEVVDVMLLMPLFLSARQASRFWEEEQGERVLSGEEKVRRIRELFEQEKTAQKALSSGWTDILSSLVYRERWAKCFFEKRHRMVLPFVLSAKVQEELKGQLCENVNIASFLLRYPVESAYALASIERREMLPVWLSRYYPMAEELVRILQQTPCRKGCAYCSSRWDIHAALKRFFGYDSFLTYRGEPLQERAVQKAVCGKSIAAVFPTGGGKSLTFQLPALMAGQIEQGLTVVISPLLSLMKDQVDQLVQRGITEAEALNSLQDPFERSKTIRRLLDGEASIVYLSPESLRSASVERILLQRRVVRFVIDEAHCFSAWGQDFRVDYLYIGDFLKELQQKKRLRDPIPVSCFTATAKPEVLEDICRYFQEKTGCSMEILSAPSDRENLHYHVLKTGKYEEKYNSLRHLLTFHVCPTIVYVSTTKAAEKLAESLTRDGFPSLPYHGKMRSEQKIAHQEAFIRNEVRVMVATSAFGMGVDKKDVLMTVHFDIPDSPENFVQESGRAGRDPAVQADCYLLYSRDDIRRHFMRLQRSKVNISEIKQIFKAIKALTKEDRHLSCSPEELASEAGWDPFEPHMEMHLKTALASLEHSGYIRRDPNRMQVYASALQVGSITEAIGKIRSSQLMSDSEKTICIKLTAALISAHNTSIVRHSQLRSRVDCLAQQIGVEKKQIISCISLLRQEGILADERDLYAGIVIKGGKNKSGAIFEDFAALECFLLEHMEEKEKEISIKELNEMAQQEGLSFCTVKKLRQLFHFLLLAGDLRRTGFEHHGYYSLTPAISLSVLREKTKRRHAFARYLLSRLFVSAQKQFSPSRYLRTISFSLVTVCGEFSHEHPELCGEKPFSIRETEEAIWYLSRIRSMRSIGNFLIRYHSLEIERLVEDSRIQYKAEDYRPLQEYYTQKNRQIHFIAEWAERVLRDPSVSQTYLHDYFHLRSGKFIKKYFKGERLTEIYRQITPDMYQELFASLSPLQTRVLQDDTSRCIVIAAGPGSGKTRVLVHKLACLLMLEDVRPEQLLMLTFSRAAATEFKLRLIELVGSLAYGVTVKTFHSYSFDLLGRIGSLNRSEHIVKAAAQAIRDGEAENRKCALSVLVLDEAQDMDEEEYTLVEALMAQNEEMKVIAVGDDDQNIYGFRGADARYMKQLLSSSKAVQYEMTDNYRSEKSIVSLAEAFVSTFRNRMKTRPLHSVSGLKGRTVIVEHTSPLFLTAVAQATADQPGNQSIGILTETNEEALQMVCLLRKLGIRAQLLRSAGGFSMFDVAEVRFLLKALDYDSDEPMISETQWQQAGERLQKVYADSRCLPNCLCMMEKFSSLYPQRYRSDLEEFLKESRFEDFYEDHSLCVTVSTIHKAKGREYDTVFLTWRGDRADQEEKKRLLYVGMTRAKKQLFIHYETGTVQWPACKGVERVRDDSHPEEPEELWLDMTFRDVFLDFFRDKKRRIVRLHSGALLAVEGEYLCTEPSGERVAKFSRAFSAELESFRQKGYEPVEARVAFVAAWRPKGETEEIAVLLPELKLKKNEPRTRNLL